MRGGGWTSAYYQELEPIVIKGSDLEKFLEFAYNDSDASTNMYWSRG